LHLGGVEVKIPEYSAGDAARAMQSISDRLQVGKAPWIQDIGIMWQFVKQIESMPTAYAYMDKTGEGFQIEDPDGMDLVDALQRGSVVIKMRPS